MTGTRRGRGRIIYIKSYVGRQGRLLARFDALLESLRMVLHSPTLTRKSPYKYRLQSKFLIFSSLFLNHLPSAKLLKIGFTHTEFSTTIPNTTYQLTHYHQYHRHDAYELEPRGRCSGKYYMLWFHFEATGEGVGRRQGL